MSTVTAVDNYGTVLSGKAAGVLYPAYTKGGGTGQSTYGLIKEWNAGYENGTSTQNLGLDRIMTDSAGTPYRFYGVGDARNYEPDWLVAAFGQQYGNLNVIDTYLSVDGYYQIQTAAGDLVWRPYLMYYVDSHPGATNQGYIAFMRAQGFAGTTDDDVRNAIIAATDASVVAATNLYLAAPCLKPSWERVKERQVKASKPALRRWGQRPVDGSRASTFDAALARLQRCWRIGFVIIRSDNALAKT